MSYQGQLELQAFKLLPSFSSFWDAMVRTMSEEDRGDPSGLASLMRSQYMHMSPDTSTSMLSCRRMHGTARPGGMSLDPVRLLRYLHVARPCTESAGEHVRRQKS